LLDSLLQEINDVMRSRDRSSYDTKT